MEEVGTRSIDNSKGVPSFRPWKTDKLDNSRFSWNKPKHSEPALGTQEIRRKFFIMDTHRQEHDLRNSSFK